MGMCDCGVKHILHVRNGMIFLPDGSYKAKQVYWRWELIQRFSIIFHPALAGLDSTYAGGWSM